MDRDALLASLPANAAFNGMFPFQRKQIAENFIESILDAIATENREPDAWEAHDIAAAIGYVAASWYSAALACAGRALVPVEERALEIPLADPAPARHLRDALAYVGG